MLFKASLQIIKLRRNFATDPWYAAARSGRLGPAGSSLAISARVTWTDPTADRSQVTITYHHKSLPCPDCIHLFEFTVAEQALYDEFGYDQPVRCRTCRQARDASRNTRHGDPPSGPRELAAVSIANAIGAPA